MSVSFTPKGIPKFRFTVMGLLDTITDIGTMPAVSQTGWTDPLIVSKARTALTLHGWSATAESLSVDLGNTVQPCFLIGEENMLISDRGATGTAVVAAKSLATINWFQKAQTRARGALSLVHGVTAGNIVEIAAPAVEIGRPTQGETQGISNYSLPLLLCTATGLDELEIIIR